MTEMPDGSTSPLVSIGMPIRNEGRFLRRSLDSLLSQKGVDFELIISDNASTDDTAAICEEYRARHAFIRYHRFDANVGASANFLHVVNEAKGRYFMWAAGHDLWDSDYLRLCVDLLEANSAIVLAFGNTRWIDAEGEDFPRFTGGSDTRGLSTEGRYFTVLWGHMNPILGVIRAENLRTKEISDLVGIDLALLTSLALEGDFAQVPRNWYRREFRKEHSYATKLERYRGKDYALGATFLARYFPLARLPMRLLADLFRSRLPLSRKLLMFLVVVVSLPVKYVVDKTRSRK
jgi:glycosyltransferase involved in cell wall biosynthesis